MSRRERVVLTTGLITERGEEVLDDPEFVRLVGAFVHPEFDAMVVSGERFRGVHGWLEMQRSWAEAWDNADYQILTWEESGETAVMEVAYRVRGAGSGVEVETKFGWIVRWRDDLLAEVEFRTSYAEALADAGLA